MPLPRALTFALLVAVLAPATASATDKFAARGEPVKLARGEAGHPVALEARPAPFRFNMVGLHWRGPGTVWFRTALEPGKWGDWQPAQPEAEDLPDLGSAEATRRIGWKLGNPYWTGPARYIEYRLAGGVTRLRTHFLWSETAAVRPSASRAGAPAIIRRSQWGADESIVRAPPWYADRVRLAIVHHTAGTNDYSAAQSAAIVRGIQRYHVLANGWNDIGYNFLVDRYGQVFEGRGGGIDQPVGGAHAQGFNTGSTGVAVLGTYSTRDITTAGRSALVKLISWRLDVAHVDPVKALTFVSNGSDRFPAGTSVRLRAVSGHRDTSSTSCPGTILYGRLGQIAQAAAARGLPKLYEPVVTGALGGPVRVRGRLSTALPWTVAIRDAAGAEVARGSGAGTAVDWTWDASAIFFGGYRYTISAGPDVLPASGRVSGPPPLVVRNLAAAPRALTPNGDGVAEATKISFSLTTSATVDVSVLDGAGATVARPVNDRLVGAGAFATVWGGEGAGGALLPDGRYTLQVDARSPAQEVSAASGIIVDRTLGFLAVSPDAFSPNGDGTRDLADIGFTLARPADVDVHIRHDGKPVAQVAAGSLGAGPVTVVWDGSNSAGERLADGSYRAVVQATTAIGTRRLKHWFTLDTTKPVVRILSARYRQGATSVRFSLNEWAVVRIWFDDTLARLERAAGTFTVSRPLRAERVRVVARDRARNRRITSAAVG
jgi:flagellar hook assembly protein FlgD